MIYSCSSCGFFYSYSAIGISYYDFEIYFGGMSGSFGGNATDFSSIYCVVIGIYGSDCDVMTDFGGFYFGENDFGTSMMMKTV